jgi:hypothetical protein
MKAKNNLRKRKKSMLIKVKQNHISYSNVIPPSMYKHQPPEKSILLILVLNNGF